MRVTQHLDGDGASTVKRADISIPFKTLLMPHPIKRWLTRLCALGLFVLNADPQRVPSLSPRADDPHGLVSVLGDFPSILVKRRNVPEMSQRADVGSGQRGVVFRVISYLSTLFCLKVHIFNSSNQESLRPVTTEQIFQSKFKLTLMDLSFSCSTTCWQQCTHL